VRWFGSHCWSAARPAYARAAAEGHQYLSVRAWLEFAAAQVADAAGPEPDVARAMALAELREFSQIRVGHLTRGIGARVALAGALLGTPHIVCLDRPFDVLMDAERARFAQVLAGVRRTGITVVVGTRDVSAVVAVAADRMHLMAGGRVGPAAGRDAALELDVPLPVEARSRLALRVPTVYRRGRALRVPLGRVSPEQVLSECRALGIEVRASRVIPHEQASRRRVAEPAPARPGRAV
jgi:energy-coupling factor transporter ATP-binding protein EcfA2